jgi:hypothetical protein
MIRYKPICTVDGWVGQTGFEEDAEREKNEHIDDHPKCDGKVRIQKVSWYDGSPVDD